MAGAIEIFINMYSGRPDPVIDLSSEEIDELRRRLQMARKEPLGEFREPPQLGYRGFVIYNEAVDAGLPYRADIYEGFVAVTEERPEPGRQSRAQPRLFRDAGQLEDWLLERAAQQGFADDIAAMGGPERKRYQAE
jgi:hypothetical protein